MNFQKYVNPIPNAARGFTDACRDDAPIAVDLGNFESTAYTNPVWQRLDSFLSQRYATVQRNGYTGFVRLILRDQRQKVVDVSGCHFWFDVSESRKQHFDSLTCSQQFYGVAARKEDRAILKWIGFKIV